ncbi:MAG: TIR domain-containing protein [Anaerolineae bacterium]|nr:TIR domain-containing protein [Anaerolineae bacterium]
MAELISSALSDINIENDEAIKDHLEDLLQALSAVIGQLKVESYPAETRLCTQGANEDTFYIIARGEAEVYLNGDTERKMVARKEAGDFFGEMALILDMPRSADVITTCPSLMLELDRRAFKRATRISERLASLLSQRTMAQLDANRRQTQEVPSVQVPPFRIFTSYSRHNQDFVRKLVADLHQSLTASNVSLWLDQEDIPIGQEWDRAVEDALETSDAMLLVLSDASTNSDNVRDEWMYYKEVKKPIIPILHERCKKPFQLIRLQHVDFVEQAYSSALAQVHMRILELADTP